MSLASRRSPWRFMPLGIIGWLLLTALVNAAMVSYALTTFPGEAGDNAFDISNSYDGVLNGAAQQARLGWSVDADAPARRPVVAVRDRGGVALSGAQVRAVAVRPLGPSRRTELHFAPAADGRFLADTTLPAPGQWDVAVVIEQAGQRVQVTRRLVVR